MFTIDQIVDGLRNPHKISRYLRREFRDDIRKPLLRRLNYPNDGFYVMEEDWDNLIILDACRFDVFQQVNTIPGTLEKKISRGSATPEFIEQNFQGREYNDTVWISANAVVGQYSHVIDVFKLIGLWGEEHANDQLEVDDDNTHPLSLTDPQPVVEKTREISETYPDKRLIIHFLPPHTPFLVKDGKRLPPDSAYRTFTAVREGNVGPSEMRAVYEENVEYVLEFVETVLQELDGKSVVTADHGELLGEGVPLSHRILDTRWPIGKLTYYDFAHYNSMRVPELVEVPWFEVDSEDSRRNITSASESEGVEMDESAIEEQLVALGYKDAL